MICMIESETFTSDIFVPNAVGYNEWGNGVDSGIDSV